MADENTPNPANPNPPMGTGAGDATLPPTEEVSPPSEPPEVQPVANADAESQTPETVQPAVDSETQETPTPETTEIPVEPEAEVQPTEAPKEEVVETSAEEVAETKTNETASEIQATTEIEDTQPEKVEEVQTEAPAEEIIKTAPQPQPEVQSEQPEIVAADEGVIRDCPPKPGDKVETAPTESISEAPLNETTTENTPPGIEKDAQPKSGFQSDGITPLDGEEKVFAAVGYVGILALLPLLARRDSEFAQHHGRQGLVVAIIFIVLWLFAKLGNSLSSLILVLQFAAIVGGFALAYKGDWFRIPWIYDLSLKIKLNPPSPRASSNETENSEAVETPSQNSEEGTPPPSQN